MRVPRVPTVLRAALAVHPAAVAALVVLLLPDRQPMLDLVDDLAAGGEGLRAMPRGHAHPYRDVADRERAEAMHAFGRQHAVAARGLPDDARAFLERERLEGLVFERRHTAALVVVAHPALEGGESAGFGQGDRGSERARVDRRLREREAAHPPATGGMKTTSSPSRSSDSQSANAALMATRSCEAGRRKPWRPASSAYRAAGVRAAVSIDSACRPACSRSSA